MPRRYAISQMRRALHTHACFADEYGVEHQSRSYGMKDALT